ncbi:MAG TPA: ABC transporter permease, partial [Bryobacteraceae bacterium]
MNWRKLKYLRPSVRRQADREMREELEALNALAETSGELGNLTLAAEDARDAWGWTWLTSLASDVRYGFRTLLRQRGFLTAALLTLALGVGANTTIFSVINATILKPLPFPDSDRLVLVWETFGSGPDNENIISAPNFWDYQRQIQSFDAMAIFGSGNGYNLSAPGQEPEQVFGLRVSAGFFPVLKAQPMLGRTFTQDEEVLNRSKEVVLSYGLWKRRYGGDTTIVGRPIKIDGEDFTVLGVMPPDFTWQFGSGPFQLWVPIGYTKNDYSRSSNSFLAIARLKTGVTLAQGRSEMAAVAERLAKQFPND